MSYTSPTSAALPLPAGAATSANQVLELAKLAAGLPAALDASGGLKVALQTMAQLAVGATPISATAGLPVVDQGVAFIAGGVTDCDPVAQVATGQTGAGYLVIVNLDASATIYIGLTGVSGSTDGTALRPTDPPWSVRITDVATIFAVGSATVNWAFYR